MILSGRAKVAGVMGWPVAHSRSPRLHGYWLETYGIDGAYVPLAVPPDGLEAALRALPALGFRGVNVTIPHKEAAARLVALDPIGRRLGAVNMVTVTEEGTLEGTNTDGIGFLESVRAAAPLWRPEEGPAVVLGAGGAARAVAAALLDEDAPEIRLVNRTRARAEGIAADLGGAIAVRDWEEREAVLADATLLVNATSLGMQGAPPLALGLAALGAQAVVADIVYSPLETDLLARARARGNRVVDGLGMLIGQARPAFARWFGRAPEVTPALRRFMVAELEGGEAAEARSQGE